MGSKSWYHSSTAQLIRNFGSHLWEYWELLTRTPEMDSKLFQDSSDFKELKGARILHSWKGSLRIWSAYYKFGFDELRTHKFVEIFLWFAKELSWEFYEDPTDYGEDCSKTISQSKSNILNNLFLLFGFDFSSKDFPFPFNLKIYNNLTSLPISSNFSIQRQSIRSSFGSAGMSWMFNFKK